MTNRRDGAPAGKGLGFSQTTPDELLYGARVSVWVRWLVLIAILIEANYRVEYGGAGQIFNTLYVLAMMSANGYVLYLVESKKMAKPAWMLGVSAMDLAAIGFSTAMSGGLASHYWVIYYPTVALFAAVFTSTRLTFVWTTLVALVYTTLCLTVGEGLDFGMQEEKILLYRLLALFTVAAAVNLITRFERVRRREAVAREIQRERIELSQRIHDTAAQSAYMVGLGIDTALKLAEESNDVLKENLEATSRFAKSAMWELRQPIETGAYMPV